MAKNSYIAIAINLIKGFYTTVILAVLLISCSNKIAQITNYPVDTKATVDYSDLNNWSAHPYKKDPSDSVPYPLQKTYVSDSSVDVFFIHPTTYIDEKLLADSINSPNSSLWNASLKNIEVNTKTDESPVLYQASIFNAAGRVFAPRYRQANYYAYFTSDTIMAAKAFDMAYHDVLQAFDYYMTHYNNGRPVIIASHSQGTTHAKRLLKERFENTPLMKQLVVAYLVGMPVEKSYYSGIPVCSSPRQTGCFCSWRTLKEGYLTNYIEKETQSSWVNNPLTWDTTHAPASRKLNEGAVLLNFNKVLPGITGGRIYKNVLWVNKPKVFGNFLMRRKNYHIADFNFFYVNVRKNVQERIDSYKKMIN